MNDVAYLAWRYLAHHRYKTIVLLLSITLIAYIPTGLRVLIRESEHKLVARADATPLLVGAKGSPLELVLNSLYFDADMPEIIGFGHVSLLRGSGFVQPIPLYVRFRSQEAPIVATTLDYFDFRELKIIDGRPMAMLGECVIGSQVAARRNLGVGDTVVSSPESAFDLAGVYPLKMSIVGVMGYSDTPDDHAIFVDLKTAWVIEGLGHGHQDLEQANQASTVLRRDETGITANASVVQYNEITAENIGSFHFHGDQSAFPITAIIAVPPDHRSATIVRGRYQSTDATEQIIVPRAIMDELLATVLTVQRFVLAALVCVGLATLASAGLVFMLSFRLRRREIATMVKIGGSRARIVSVLCSEVAIVVVIAAGASTVLTWMTGRFGPEIIRLLLLA